MENDYIKGINRVVNGVLLKAGTHRPIYLNMFGNPRLEQLQKIVDGYIEFVDVKSKPPMLDQTHEFYAYCDEEALIKHKEKNSLTKSFIGRDDLYGDVIVIDVTLLPTSLTERDESQDEYPVIEEIGLVAPDIGIYSEIILDMIKRKGLDPEGCFSAMQFILLGRLLQYGLDSTTNYALKEDEGGNLIPGVTSTLLITSDSIPKTTKQLEGSPILREFLKRVGNAIKNRLGMIKEKSFELGLSSPTTMPEILLIFARKMEGHYGKLLLAKDVKGEDKPIIGNLAAEAFGEYGSTKRSKEDLIKTAQILKSFLKIFGIKLEFVTTGSKEEAEEIAKKLKATTGIDGAHVNISGDNDMVDLVSEDIKDIISDAMSNSDDESEKSKRRRKLME